MPACRVCGGTSATTVWSGRIRTGRFGDASADAYTVSRCDRCGVVALPAEAAALAQDYETDEYRESFDGAAGAAHFFALHDAEQAEHLAMVGVENVRGAVVADIGCAAGSFLDVVRGVADECVGIEPSHSLRSSLEGRGYEVHAYASDAARVRPASIDLAVSFAVLEHVEDPVGFLRDIRELLRPGATLWVSTPNAADAMLELLPDVYAGFFYRSAHAHYFDAGALEHAIRAAGLEPRRIVGRQRFGLGNAIGWLRDRRPQGDLFVDAVTPAMDAVWRAELERTLRCDFLYAEAFRPGPDDPADALG